MINGIEVQQKVQPVPARVRAEAAIARAENAFYLYTRTEMGEALGVNYWQISRDVKGLWPSYKSSHLTKAMGYTLYVIGCYRLWGKHCDPPRTNIGYAELRKVAAWPEEKTDAFLRLLQDSEGNPAGYQDYQKRLDRIHLERGKRFARSQQGIYGGPSPLG